MRALSTFASLLCPRKGLTTADDLSKVLLPRTAADELPPYRGQPWLIDRRGHRKVDPNLTLVPASRI
jgi:hypothetical protein